MKYKQTEIDFGDRKILDDNGRVIDNAEFSELVGQHVKFMAKEGVKIRGKIVKKMVSCGRCRRCNNGPGHGPYLYVKYRCGKRTTLKYLGKYRGQNEQ